MMNKQSGLAAISGVSSDCRDIEAGANDGDERCQMAIDMWSYRVASQFATMVQAMNGVDTMVFTAGGRELARMRKEVERRLDGRPD